MNQKENIDLIIDQYNSIKAQNVALTQAFSSLLAVLPEELRAEVQKQFDLRCATFQVFVNDGKTELDALTIQREQFAIVRQRIFHN